ncbi:MAG: glycosyltransferase family 4 protein [Ignavibacteriae bacterium]|nr:glycosyltransferase family 4 protein [Ignavibacteriota bacterium]
MKLLIVGKRANSSGISEGPVTAFESLVEGLRGSQGDVRVFPDRPGSRIWMYISLLAQVWRRLDVINVHLAANFRVLIGLLRPRSVHTVLTVHGYSPLESVDHAYNAFMHRLQIRYLFRNRVYVSSLIRERVEAREGLSGGVVIPNAVRPLPSIGLVGVEGRDVDLFSLCGYSRTKGGAVLNDALASIHGRLSVVIAGQGAMSGGWVESSQHEVVHAGPLAGREVAAIFSRCRVYVQPSVYESFGIPVVEALYA